MNMCKIVTIFYLYYNEYSMFMALISQRDRVFLFLFCLFFWGGGEGVKFLFISQRRGLVFCNGFAF